MGISNLLNLSVSTASVPYFPLSFSLQKALIYEPRVIDEDALQQAPAAACEVVDPDGLLNQLRFLRSMNVDGVMVDCWWGIVEAHINGYFKWCVSLSSSYRFGEFSDVAFRVVADDCVTSYSGTGIVHCAPAFGEDDYRVCLENQIIHKGENLVMAVDDDGCFTERVIDFIGQYVKEADKDIIQAVKARIDKSKLVKSGSFTHSYPFCWRSDTPFINRAVPADHEKACTIPDKEIKEHDEKEKDTSEDTEQREHDQDDKYCDVTHHFSQNKPPRTLEDSVVELFHQEDVHHQMLCLPEKVKERLSNSDDYQSFLMCIAEYCTKSITRAQLQSRVNSLLGAYPDIVEEVNEFIDRSEKTRSLWSHGHLPGVIKGNHGGKDGNSDGDEMEKNSSAINENCSDNYCSQGSI
ncbi:unnamed protein product [Lactuca saligna]|uniref:Beta-amylase n=1 Tax=Lactuca saligna TaxID=75948 RepID=A0AA36EHS7_LACSI|nr:unnamed protein product [Lactuca saligna]